jgi:hypothetical protein
MLFPLAIAPIVEHKRRPLHNRKQKYPRPSQVSSIPDTTLAPKSKDSYSNTPFADCSGQFGNCLGATTWNSREVNICIKKEIGWASARGKGAHTVRFLARPQAVQGRSWGFFHWAKNSCSLL